MKVKLFQHQKVF